MRDFTYVEDIVEGIIRVSDDIAHPNSQWDSSNPDPASSNAPYRLFNIGNSNPVSLNEYIMAVETALGKKAIRELLPLQAGDVQDTFADVSALVRQVGYKPSTTIKQGVSNFVSWYRTYYQIQ